MRFLTIVLLLLVSGAVAAGCIELSGNYSCIADDGYTRSMKIFQKDHFYTIDFGSAIWNIVADGKERKVSDPPGYTNVREQSWCDSKKITVMGVGRALDGKGGSYGIETSYTKLFQAGSALIYDVSSTLVMDGSGEKHHYQIRFRCGDS